MKIFIIHSLSLTKKAIKWANILNSKGHNTYVPGADTDQSADRHKIIKKNLEKIEWADECMLIWDGKSQGSLVDIGSAMALRKPLTILEVCHEPVGKDAFGRNELPWTGFCLDYEGGHIWK